MNRKIQFRIWDKNGKMFYYSGSVYLSADGLGLLFLCLDGNEYIDEPFLSENYVVQQFTGLKDKNGKEIYEGDIFRWINANDYKSEKQETGVVKYCGNAFNLFELGERYNITHYLTNASINGSIIGNIFENPELLKNENNS